MCIDDYILEHSIEFRSDSIGKNIISTFTKRRKKMKILKAMCAAAVALSLVGCAQTSNSDINKGYIDVGLYAKYKPYWFLCS